MSDYAGVERRKVPTESEMYQLVCGQRFESVNRDIEKLDRGTKAVLDSIQKTVGQTRERVFNGLSDLPDRMKEINGRMNWVLGILVLFLLGFSVGFGTLMYTTGQRQARIETLIESHLESVTHVSRRDYDD